MSKLTDSSLHERDDTPVTSHERDDTPVTSKETETLTRNLLARIAKMYKNLNAHNVCILSLDDHTIEERLLEDGFVMKLTNLSHCRAMKLKLIHGITIEDGDSETDTPPREIADTKHDDIKAVFVELIDQLEAISISLKEVLIKNIEGGYIEIAFIINDSNDYHVIKTHRGKSEKGDDRLSSGMVHGCNNLALHDFEFSNHHSDLRENEKSAHGMMSFSVSSEPPHPVLVMNRYGPMIKEVPYRDVTLTCTHKQSMRTAFSLVAKYDVSRRCYRWQRTS